MDKRRELELENINDGYETRFTDSNEIICPWCGHGHYPEIDGGIDSLDMDCENCDKEFRVNVSFYIDYSTERIETALQAGSGTGKAEDLELGSTRTLKTP